MLLQRRRRLPKPPKPPSPYSWIVQRPWNPQSASYVRPPEYDFDGWLYLKPHPQRQQGKFQEDFSSFLFPQLAVAAEDIKFAFNAYNLIRVCRFYGVGSCTATTACANTTPPLDIAARGNRIFHMNCQVSTPLMKSTDGGGVVKVGLTAHPAKGICINDFDWKKVLRIKREQQNSGVAANLNWVQHISKKSSNSNGTNFKNDSDESQPLPVRIQLVVGMENGMSDKIADECDFCVHIPQYGSIGSLSMINALSVGMHAIHTGLRGKEVDNSSTDKDVANFVTSDKVCAEGPDSCNVGKLYPHAAGLLGQNDATINHTLALQREKFPLQLSLVWWNNLGDRNIGASIRNANIYNVEHMIILNRRKYSRRGTVGCHHYTPIHHLNSMKEVDDRGLLHGYEKWCLVNEYPYLCNYLYAESNGIADLNVVCARSEAVEESAFLPLPPGGIAREDKKILYLDDEVSLLQELKSAKEKRSARGIAIFVPDEGSTLTPEMDRMCSVRIRVLNPHASFGQSAERVEEWRKDYQAGLPSSLSTAIALDKLRTLIQDHL